MCLILFAYKQHPDYPLIMLSNRDEFFNRPSEAAHHWPDQPQIFAGRDQQAKGTWLGVNQQGQLAAVTNFREPTPAPKHALSRGELTARFLSEAKAPDSYRQSINYLVSIDQNHHRYAGFNLLIGNAQQLLYYSNRSRDIQLLPAGMHGLSNGLLNAPWPKVDLGKQTLEQQLDRLDREALLGILGDTQQPDDHLLPETGVGIEAERMLGSRFIQSEHYGTRASSLLLIDQQGRIEFTEQTFFSDGQPGSRIEQIITP